VGPPSQKKKKKKKKKKIKNRDRRGIQLKPPVPVYSATTCHLQMVSSQRTAQLSNAVHNPHRGL